MPQGRAFSRSESGSAVPRECASSRANPPIPRRFLRPLCRIHSPRRSGSRDLIGQERTRQPYAAAPSGFTRTGRTLPGSHAARPGLYDGVEVEADTDTIFQPVSVFSRV